MSSLLCKLGLHKDRPIKHSIKAVGYDRWSRETIALAFVICVRDNCDHEHEMTFEGYNMIEVLNSMAVSKGKKTND